MPNKKKSKSKQQPARQKAPKAKQRTKTKPQSSIGARVGSHVGDMIEQGARGLFRRITGIGDYKVARNTILSAGDPPVLNNGIRSNVIRHREFITDLTGSTAFAATTYAINPGNPTLFPWLAAIAQSYEQYVFHGIVFEFKSTSASALNNTNTALGTVIMATEYNVLGTPFTSKLSMENHEFTTSTRPSENMMHPIECDVTQTPTRVFYNRPNISLTNNDLRFVDMGNFCVATVGMQAASVIGEIWCTYEVELLKPALLPSVSFTNLSAMWSFLAVSTTTVFGTGTPTVNKYGSAILWESAMTFGTTTLTLNNIAVWPIGSKWTLIYSINGATATVVFTALTYANASNASIFDNGAANSSLLTSIGGGGNDAFGCMLSSFTVTSSPITITWNGGTYPASNSASLALIRWS